MQPPKCKSCGKAEWRHSCVVEVSWPSILTARWQSSPVAEVGAVVNMKNPVVVNRKRDRHKKTELRTVYMREYMRKRRAVKEV